MTFNGKGLGEQFPKMLAPNAVSFKYSCQKAIQLNYLLNACYCARPYAEHCRPEILKMLQPINIYLL